MLCMSAFPLFNSNQKYDKCQFKGKHSKYMNYNFPIFLHKFGICQLDVKALILEIFLLTSNSCKFR